MVASMIPVSTIGPLLPRDASRDIKGPRRGGLVSGDEVGSATGTQSYDLVFPQCGHLMEQRVLPVLLCFLAHRVEVLPVCDDAVVYDRDILACILVFDLYVIQKPVVRFRIDDRMVVHSCSSGLFTERGAMQYAGDAAKVPVPHAEVVCSSHKLCLSPLSRKRDWWWRPAVAAARRRRAGRVAATSVPEGPSRGGRAQLDGRRRTADSG